VARDRASAQSPRLHRAPSLANVLTNSHRQHSRARPRAAPKQRGGTYGAGHHMPGRPGRWLPSAGRDKATVPYPREVARARTHARGRRPPPGVGRCARSCSRVSPLSSSRQVDADPAALARRSGAEMAKLTAGPTAHFRWAPGPFAAAACSGVLRQVVAVCAGPPRVSWPAGRAPRYLSCSSLRRRSRALAH
jgi:hypothetical protein